MLLGSRSFSRSRLFARRLVARRFNLGFNNGHRLAGAGEGVGAGVASRALAAATSTTSTPGFAATLGAGAFRAGPGLGPVGCDDFDELAILEELGHGAQGQAQGRHGGSQAEGLLDGAGGAHFVVTQADAETARFPIAAFTTASFTTALPTAFTTTTLASATPAAEATVLLALGAG